MKVKEILNLNNEEIVQDYAAGLSTCEIGKKFGVSNASVYIYLRDKCGIEMRKLPTLDKYKDRLIKMHSEGLSLYRIQKELNVPVTTLNRYSRKLGLDFSKNLRQREVPIKTKSDEIVKDYNSGFGCYKLAKKYDCAQTSIIRLLKDNDVEIRPLRKNFLNEDYFEKIDSPEKAYLLGFMVGDGYNKGDGKIVLSITDKEIIEFMKKEIEFTGDHYNVDARGENHKPQYSLQIYSKKMAADLNNLGCIAGKTFTAKFPTYDQVPEHLMKFWILGLFDADGTICCSKRNDANTLQWNINICGTEELIKGMLFFLLQNFSTHFNILSEKSENMELFKIRPTSQQGIYDFLSWLYSDAPFFLKRKHDKYLEFCDQNF